MQFLDKENSESQMGTMNFILFLFFLRREEQRMGVIGGIFTIQPKVKQKGWGDGNAFVMNRGGGGGPFGNVVAAKVCTKMNFPTSRKRDRRNKKKKKSKMKG